MKVELFCGDCTKIMPDIDMNNAVIVTDPPFNLGYHYRTFKDRAPEEEYYAGLANVLTTASSFVCVHYPDQLHKVSMFTGRFPEKVVTWVYNSNTTKQHRDIGYYGIKPDFRRIRQPYKNPEHHRIKAQLAKGSKGARLYDWWNVEQLKGGYHEKTAHPCQMPVEVMRRAIGILPIDESWTVIDPYMGAGTTGVACKMLGINFVGIELDEQYFAIANERIKN